MADALKTCSKCQQKKPISDFNNRKDSQDGKRAYCKTCHHVNSKNWRSRNPEKQKALAKNWSQNNKLSRENSRLKHVYGITLDEKLSLVHKQNNLCAICKIQLIDPRKAHVDHCHGTGVVRGVLCNNCNIGLGLFKDDVTTLKSAIEYLTEGNNNG